MAYYSDYLILMYNAAFHFIGTLFIGVVKIKKNIFSEPKK